jgi:hypothetical protein
MFHAERELMPKYAKLLFFKWFVRADRETLEQS